MKVDKKTIVAIVLVVIAVFIVVRQLGGIKSKTPRAIKKTSGRSAVASKTGTTAGGEEGAVSASAKNYRELIANVKESDLDFNRPGFVDPMTPLISPMDKEKKGPSGPAANVGVGQSDALGMGYRIEGIVWDEAAPLALINGQVVGVGEQLEDGALITEITPDTVRFTIGGRQYFLVFREE